MEHPFLMVRTWAHGSRATDIICPMYSELGVLRAWSAFASKNAPREKSRTDEKVLRGAVELWSGPLPARPFPAVGAGLRDRDHWTGLGRRRPMTMGISKSRAPSI